MSTPPFRLKREAELLLQIARPVLDDANRARIRALIQSGLDWDSLHQIVTRHRLGPFLYAHLNSVAPTMVPRPVFMDLWRTHENNVRRNTLLATELARIVTLLEESGVPVVAYKGPILALQLYGDVAMREFEDLDLLVRFDDLARVKQLLGADRYEVDRALDPAAEASMYRSRTQYHRVFVHRDSGEKIEVHWKTDAHFPIEQTGDDAWWRSLDHITIDGQSIRTFDTTDQLLLLALHVTKHQGHRLSWLVEIAQLLTRSDLDWTRIEEVAARTRSRRRIFVSLLLAHRWVDAPLPSALRARLEADRAIVAAADRIAERFFTFDVEERQGLDRLRLDLQLCDSWTQRVRYGKDVAFAPSLHEWTTYRLPRSLEFLYVPLRVARLAMKYARRT